MQLNCGRQAQWPDNGASAYKADAPSVRKIQNLPAVFADFVADHTANRSAAHRAQRATAGQHCAGYRANACACSSVLTLGCATTHAKHCRCEYTDGQSINCFHLNLLAVSG
jgi:hypothetical protein